MVKFPNDPRQGHRRLAAVGRLRGEVAAARPGRLAREGVGGRRRPVRPQHRLPRAGARAVPRGPRGGRAREPAPAGRGRPGRGARRAVPQPPVLGVPARPRLLPVRDPERSGRGSPRGGDRRGTARGRRRRRLRPGARRGHEPGEPGDRRPRLLGRPGRGGAPWDGVRPGASLPGGPPRGQAFPRARRHLRGLPRGASRRGGGPGDALRARAGTVPPGDPRADPGADDRPRGLPGARPFAAPRHAFRGDPRRAAAGNAAVPGNGLLGRAGDEGDLLAARHGRGGGHGGRRGVRRRAGVPRGGSPGGSDRAARAGGEGRRRVQASSVGGGPPFGSASGVGEVGGTSAAGPAVPGVGPASGAFGASVGALGRYRANIAGR